ncbi:MAG: hypothetical protein ABLT11_05265 [Candidatus Acidiferrum sp.]
MPGMDMSGKNGMEDMGDMGPSMAAMAGHMYMTPLRPQQPGDVEKVKDVVAKLKSTMDRYKDYRKALKDGYVIANPKLKQPQYHFLNQANTHEADLQFDPTKPTALLYRSMFGSINTQEACTAERGTFHPFMFTWMIHVFPYEPDPKQIFSMNDDIPHVR